MDMLSHVTHEQQAMDKLASLGEDVKNIHITSGRSIDEINTSKEYHNVLKKVGLQIPHFQFVKVLVVEMVK